MLSCSSAGSTADSKKPVENRLDTHKKGLHTQWSRFDIQYSSANTICSLRAFLQGKMLWLGHRTPVPDLGLLRCHPPNPNSKDSSTPMLKAPFSPLPYEWMSEDYRHTSCYINITLEGGSMYRNCLAKGTKWKSRTYHRNERTTNNNKRPKA